MRGILALSLTALMAASGCVTYDNKDIEDTGVAGDDGSFHESPDDDGTEGEQDEDPGFQLILDPPQAEQGEIFIGYISAEGDVDLSIVDDVRIFGDVELISMDNRDDEIVLTVEVLPNALTGAMDIALVLDDETTIWFDGALTIYEAGTGNSAAEFGSDDDGEDHVDDCP